MTSPHDPHLLGPHQSQWLYQKHFQISWKYFLYIHDKKKKKKKKTSKWDLTFTVPGQSVIVSGDELSKNSLFIPEVLLNCGECAVHMEWVL